MLNNSSFYILGIQNATELRMLHTVMQFFRADATMVLASLVPCVSMTVVHLLVTPRSLATPDV